MKHVPVLKTEVINFFDPKPGQIYIDCTFGGGGHTQALLEAGCTVIAIDRDSQAQTYADELLQQGHNIWFYNRLFSQIQQVYHQWEHEYLMSKYGEYTWDDVIERPYISGILADFGICTHQLHNNKGFSFKQNDPLDMRMGKSKITAAEILRTYSETQLADMFFYLSDEPQSRLLAKRIVDLRKKQSITHMFDLLKIFQYGAGAGKIHPATRVLQALRIEVNQELKEIHHLLHAVKHFQQAQPFKLACISFHSGEDRIIKNIFQQWKREDICSDASSKPITPGADEIERNTASRSAKLRTCTIVKTF